VAKSQLHDEDLSQFTDAEIGCISDFYTPWPHQEVFHLSGAKFRLQVGGYGSGKSRPLLMEAIFHAIEYPGSNSIILRKTIPDLKRTVIDKFKADVPKRFYERGRQQFGTYNESDHIVYWPPVHARDRDGNELYEPDGQPKMLQSKIYFAACERDGDVSKFLSTEYVFIGFEELGEFSFSIWDALAGRNRCPIVGSRPCMAAATNPMGIGWSWIKKLWVDHKPAEGMNPTKFKATDYEFFHSTVDQNPIYMEDSEYIATLEASPNASRIRWGSLEAKTGQYFDNWEPLRHIRAVEDFIFEDWQPVWVGWDYGFGHYACITFWTKARRKPRWEGDPIKTVNVAIKELYFKELTVEEQVAALIAAIPRTYDKEGVAVGYKWQIDSIHFSWERFIERTKTKSGNIVSVADMAGDLLVEAGLVRPTRSNTDRVAGWTKMYSLLDIDELYVIGKEQRVGDAIYGCPVLAEAIPLLVRGDGITTDIEDVVKPKGLSLNDDMGDSARYAVSGTLLAEEEKPREVELKEQADKITEPLAKHALYYREWIRAQRLGNQPTKEKIIPSWMQRIRKGQ
jgi:hypothetical protein